MLQWRHDPRAKRQQAVYNRASQDLREETLLLADKKNDLF